LRKLKLTIAAAAASMLALALAAAAGAALVPKVFDPGNTGCPKAAFANGVLHLEKNCATATNASAGADVTGLDGQSFASATFTLASTSQCQGGSPRFNVQTSNGLFFLGCNNVAPVVNANGSATYTFTAQTLAANGQQVPTPTGAISGVEVLIDVQGTADLTGIAVNGVAQVPAPAKSDKNACKHGGWKTFSNPSFRNQGQCVSHFVHLANQARHQSGHGNAAKGQGNGKAKGHGKQH
jgi:hypothetical protein